MSKKAWVKNGDFVHDVCQGGDPFEFYHPDIAKFYTVDVPDDIVHGATLKDGVWVNAPLPPLVVLDPPKPLPPADPVTPETPKA